ncbi:unnamed protein product, partial [Ranitomeya imitator]
MGFSIRQIKKAMEATGAREADPQNITVLAMWMIEHPDDEERYSGRASEQCQGGVISGAGGKANEVFTGDISSSDTPELEECFCE